MTGISDRGRLGQAQILAAILFLFLIPTTVIIAQNVTNSSNSSEPLFPNLSLEGNLIQLPMNLTDSNTSNVTNQNPTNISEEPPVSNESSETNSSNSSVNEELQLNQTFNLTEPINDTSPLNQTLNETLSLNNTLPKTNQTIPEDNVTVPENETVKIPPLTPPKIYPSLTISIIGPDMVMRGEDPTFSAEITNIGNEIARHVNGFWELPDLSEHKFECGDLVAGETCTRELILPTAVGTPVGVKEIGVVVRYD